MEKKTTQLRRLLESESFITMPAAYDALTGRLIEKTGFKVAYNGGFVTGGSLATSEPLLTMNEQVRVAGGVAAGLGIPVVADGGAGFGEPLHTMRSVKEFIRAGVAGIHIEDQLYPKRAHYHKYVAHAIPKEEFIDKIKYACVQRDESDKDFVIIARSDVCRFDGVEAAVDRINAAAEVGADYGLIFPRDDDEMERAPKLSSIPLVYVLSRGNRDKRPLPSLKRLEDMGYRACIDAVTSILISFHFTKLALGEMLKTGDYAGMSAEECRNTRQEIEDLIGLEKFYEIEEATVEERKWGKR